MRIKESLIITVPTRVTIPQAKVLGYPLEIVITPKGDLLLRPENRHRRFRISAIDVFHRAMHTHALKTSRLVRSYVRPYQKKRVGVTKAQFKQMWDDARAKEEAEAKNQS